MLRRSSPAWHALAHAAAATLGIYLTVLPSYARAYLADEYDVRSRDVLNHDLPISRQYNTERFRGLSHHSRRQLALEGLQHNVSNSNSQYAEQYDYFDDTAMTGFTLSNAGGTCDSYDSSLSPAVTECAGKHQLCCFDASQVKVRVCCLTTYLSSSKHAALP